jgi:hypothetical protein
LKQIELFETTYGIPYGRLDKAAEIPEHVKLVNDDLKMLSDLDKQWYIDAAKKRINSLRTI